MTDRSTLVLRLAGPLQSWGTRGEFNRRDTDLMPSKSGVIGLLAAAQGRRRGADLSDLVDLNLAVRADAPGSVLRDYHTVSDYRGQPLLSASVLTSGMQKRTSPKKTTHVTERYYLQDATFLAGIEGPTSLLESLSRALRHPVFPLALGRRACAPVQPLIVRSCDGKDIWEMGVRNAIESVPWQVSRAQAKAVIPYRWRARSTALAASIELCDVNTHSAAQVVADVPVSFAPTQRGFTTRRIVHDWVTVETPFTDADLPAETDRAHDPFDLLG